jgi:HK97 family phage major capsid protein
MELNKVVAEMQSAFAEFKAANDARLKSIESKGYAPADLQEKVDKLNEEVQKKSEELAAIKTAMARTPGADQKHEKRTEAEIKAAKLMSDYLRKGEGERELKALSSDSGEDGGLLVTPQMSSEIVTKVFETSPMRQYASVQVISTSSLEILQDLDEAGAGWVGEVEPRPETATPKLNMIEIPVHEIYAEPKATQRLLDDAAVNMEAWLSEKVADRFARIENAAFVAGDGDKKPKGFLSYAAGTGFGQIQQIMSGSPTTITGDSLIELMYSLKTAYKPNARHFMSRDAIKTVRLLKDLDGRYLWAPGLDGQTAGSVLGYEIVEFQDMPTVAGGNLVVAFGDMRQAYQIVDRIGIRVLRDPFTAKPFVKFYTTKRVGGGVKNFEAIKLLKVGV